MSEYVFKEIDQEGLETLKAISEAKNFNRWMYESIAPHCQGRILEIGSGIGNISELFVKDGKEICLSDLRDNYLEFLSANFTSKNTDIIKLDIVDPDFDTSFKEYHNSFDTVFALNVVEHIKDHELALKNIHKLLRPGGKVVILVPAYNTIYNSFDKALEHYRRYTSKTLNPVIEQANFKIVSSHYFNAAGIGGWVLTGGIMRKETIPAGQMKLYDKLVPIFRIVDRILFKRIGLSVISVGQK